MATRNHRMLFFVFLVYTFTLEIVCPLLLQNFCNVATDIVCVPAPRAQLVLGISVGYISHFTNSLCANVLVFSFRGTLLSKFAASFPFLMFNIIIDYVTSEILSQRNWRRWEFTPSSASVLFKRRGPPPHRIRRRAQCCHASTLQFPVVRSPSTTCFLL